MDIKFQVEIKEKEGLDSEYYINCDGRVLYAYEDENEDGELGYFARDIKEVEVKKIEE